MFEQKATAKSLDEVHASVDTTTKTGIWRKLFSFLGPAYLVSVGYMDPGNWATDIAGGSKYGYTLLWVLLMSNLMALILQSLSARLGLVRGLDLAQASREHYPRFINFMLWIFAEIAIAAMDLAEVIGMAIGLQLLFGLPMLIGVSITVADTLLLLALQRYGMRKMEAFILALIVTIGIAFIAQMVFVKPEGTELVQGLIPSIPDFGALYIAIGIIGATVMPHNLYLHSSLVQTRKIHHTKTGIKQAIKYNFIDTALALNMAFFVNAAILILAAGAFYKSGLFEVDNIQDAHKMLYPLLGNALAPALFAVALIASGQSSTLTGTLSGQIVMEGYLNLRITPWLRRLITRIIAIIPAYITIIYFGEGKTGELLILSQVVLSLQLGFAIIPLIYFVSEKETMGEFAIKTVIKIAAWTCASVIILMNVIMIGDTLINWISAGESNFLIYFAVILAVIIAGALLIYITFSPLFKKMRKEKEVSAHGITEHLRFSEEPGFKRIAVTIDFSSVDSKAVSHALSQGGKDAEYILIHIEESAGALMMESEIEDHESGEDQANLQKYVDDLKKQGYHSKAILGYGNPKKSIPQIVNSENADLLVMGAHGHRTFKDLIFGTTMDAVRHQVKVPVLIVR